MRSASHQKGFTLAEMLAVLGILGLVTLIASVQIGNFANKANLEQAGGDIRAFIDSARPLTVTSRGPVTVRYVVTGNRSSLQLVTSAGTTQATYAIPSFVKPSFNPAGSLAPSAWPTPAPGDLFICDTQGRTLNASTNSMVSSAQDLAITHRGMLDETGFGRVRPRLRYDIQVNPLWALSVTKKPY